MVGRPPAMPENGIPDGEENTHRVWSNRMTTTLLGHLEGRIDTLRSYVTESVHGARVEAQTANDSLQRLVEAAMASVGKLNDVRFSAQEVALSKTEGAITLAAKSASSALSEVNSKAEMRATSADHIAAAVEQKIAERLSALQQLIDLRASMNEVAVAKANDANEKRFEAVNEFRETLSDQARLFVTIPVIDAKTGQLSAQIDALERQTRQAIENLQHGINGLASRLDRGEGGTAGQRQAAVDNHMTTGSVVGIVSGVSAVFMLLATVVIGYVNMNHTPAPLFNPTVGADTKRVDDLNNRFDALSNRLSSMQRERVTVPGP